MGILSTDRADLITKFNFLVYIDLHPFGFTKISNISHSIDYETIKEGGVNDMVHLVKKPKETPDKVVLEKGLSLGLLHDKPIQVGITLAKGILIIIMKNGKPRMELFCDTCMVTKWEYDGFDATSNQMAIKKIEIAYNGFKEISI
ncbi:MAG: phage tail protein [Lachnospiraceae bacterium]